MRMARIKDFFKELSESAEYRFLQTAIQSEDLTSRKEIVDSILEKIVVFQAGIAQRTFQNVTGRPVEVLGTDKQQNVLAVALLWESISALNASYEVIGQAMQRHAQTYIPDFYQFVSNDPMKLGKLTPNVYRIKA